MKRYAVTAFLVALHAFPAAAQERQISARSGQETQAGWIGSVGENCTPNTVPAVKPAQLAQHGQIKLVQGEVQTNSVPNCPGVKIPAVVVFYTSTPGYKGADSFTLSTEEGSDQIYKVTVE